MNPLTRSRAALKIYAISMGHVKTIDRQEIGHIAVEITSMTTATKKPRFQHPRNRINSRRFGLRADLSHHADRLTNHVTNSKFLGDTVIMLCNCCIDRLKLLAILVLFSVGVDSTGAVWWQ